MNEKTNRDRNWKIIGIEDNENILSCMSLNKLFNIPGPQFPHL